MEFKLAWNLRFSCLSLPNARIKGVHHHNFLKMQHIQVVESLQVYKTVIWLSYHNESVSLNFIFTFAKVGGSVCLIL